MLNRKSVFIISVIFVLLTILSYKRLEMGRMYLEERFAVFSCSTPGNNSHRGFDYAFYLPLTALAWQRIGFKSIILIIGERQYWSDHPVLSFILESLQKLNYVTIFFIAAETENRLMLSQTARLFVANFYPAKENDYLLTTDADLWPISAHHFSPRENKSLVILHSHCCGQFQHNNQSFRMIPMAHIGASASTWREIINANQTSLANDADSILEYFQNLFGPR